ncbi:MAG: ABC transporter ATP-binding protein [Bacteroidales bacterium]
MKETKEEREIILKLNNVSVGYKKTVYSKINASAGKGEMIAVIGANGTGKSTLLKSISGILPYKKGEITIFESDIRKEKPNQLATKIAFVPAQSLRARNFSLFDMLATGCYNRSNWLGTISYKDQILIKETLQKVGLTKFKDRDIATLSDGEFQRASIARSLVQNSQIILLDEPSAFLDIANKIIVTKLLKEITKSENKTVIFSTHDLQQAIKICDQIWILGYNNFIEGTPTSLIEKGAFDKIFKDSSLKFNQTLLTFV